MELTLFGWLLIGYGNIIARGAGPVDGLPDLMSSTRAELYGFGSVAEFLFHLQQYSGGQEYQSKVMVWINNKAALQQINQMQCDWARWK